LHLLKTSFPTIWIFKSKFFVFYILSQNKIKRQLIFKNSHLVDAVK